MRNRAISAGIGFAVFAALGLFTSTQVWTQWWFYVGLTTAVTATFVESFLTKPQDGVVNSVGAVAAYFSASVDTLEPLWTLYLVVAIATGVMSAASTITRAPSFWKSVCYQVSIRVGRTVTLGCAALALEVTSAVVQGRAGGVWLGVGTFLLAISLSFDWFGTWKKSRRSDVETLDVVDAQSPSLLVVEGISGDTQSGQQVRVRGSQTSVSGTVAIILPGKERSRALIALDGEARSVVPGITGEIELEHLSSTTLGMAGLAAAGSTPTSVTFGQLREVQIGELLTVQVGGSDCLYQVTNNRLNDEAWSGSKSLTPRASALLLGQHDSGWLRMQPRLPAPHAIVKKPPGAVAGSLPETHHRIGVLKGSHFPIGVVSDSVVSGHVAVVGMSGMGKSNLVSSLCKSLGSSRFVLTADTTGEYSQRLSFPTWDKSDMTLAGHFVVEPKGDQPQQASKLVKQLMDQSVADYAANAIVRRVLCLEEAHTFVPEWNFCAKNQTDDVNYIARMVMQARKYGLSFIVVTQRTAVLSKSVLSQCESYIVFRTLDDTSLQYLETVGGPVVRDVVPSLRRYEALCIGPAFNSESPVIVEIDGPSADGLQLILTETATEAEAEAPLKTEG